MGTKEGSSRGLPLRVEFVMSANNLPQRVVRFSGEKASLAFLLSGITLSIFGILMITIAP